VLLIEGAQTKTHTNSTQSSLTHSSEKIVSLLLLVSLLQSPERERERERRDLKSFSVMRERERRRSTVQSEPLHQEVTSHLNQQTHLLPPIYIFCFALICFTLLL